MKDGKERKKGKEGKKGREGTLFFSAIDISQSDQYLSTKQKSKILMSRAMAHCVLLMQIHRSRLLSHAQNERKGEIHRC